MEKLFDPLICNEIYKHEWDSNIEKVNDVFKRLTRHDQYYHEDGLDIYFFINGKKIIEVTLDDERLDDFEGYDITAFDQYFEGIYKYI